MLRLIIEGDESFNNETQMFETLEPTIIELEHSLISLSKWEAKHQKPFLSSGKKSSEEIFNYLKMMVLTPNVDPDAFYKCSQKELDSIQLYIDSNQSATSFGVMPERRGPGEVITSELIYYWMVSFNIPFECQSWHLNRLFALVRICNIKNSKPKRMSRGELAQQNRDLNAKRRSELGTSG